MLIIVWLCVLQSCLGQVSEDEVRSALCQGKPAGEYFRLVPGDRHCRDVVACADDGLKALRCPPELAFDIEKQTCDWKAEIDNCNVKSKPRKALPLLQTEEPLCAGSDELACGDGTCLPRHVFCDGVEDCADSSDENYCGLRQDPNGSDECDPEQCQLPDCFCSKDSTEIPGGHLAESVPQMITISFDDAVNNNNFPVYKKIFDGTRVNPNGCGIKATFFVTNQFNNYSMIEALHNAGNEIASHSMTHSDVKDYWTDGSKEQWLKEFSDGREALEHFAKMPEGSILGARAPNLRVGGNRQFEALQDAGFLYDSSMVTRLQNPPLWPYNVYYSIPHECYGDSQKCPTRSYNVWEMVINEFDRREDPNTESEDQVGCVTLDGCNTIQTPTQLYNVLSHNFVRHYTQNKAPMNIYLHAAWFHNNPEMLDAFLYWMDETLSDYPDAYFLTYSQVIEWIQNPVKSAQVTARNLPGWVANCNIDRELADLVSCRQAHNCKLPSPGHNGAPQRLHTCLECPAVYPWLDNPMGGIVQGVLV